eukprot:11007917-Heterocapsa_arctica.AAC.1
MLHHRRSDGNDHGYSSKPTAFRAPDCRGGDYLVSREAVLRSRSRRLVPVCFLESDQVASQEQVHDRLLLVRRLRRGVTE